MLGGGRLVNPVVKRLCTLPQVTGLYSGLKKTDCPRAVWPHFGNKPADGDERGGGVTPFPSTLPSLRSSLVCPIVPVGGISLSMKPGPTEVCLLFLNPHLEAQSLK